MKIRVSFVLKMPALIVASLLLTFGPAVAQERRSSVPLWQMDPFDRMELVNDETHDIFPDRIKAGTTFPEPKKDEYIGTPGLLPLKEIKGDLRSVLFKIKLRDDELEYYIAGRSIRKLSYYEDLLLTEGMRLLKIERKFDEAHDYFKTVLDRDPDWPGLLQALIVFQQEEADWLLLLSKFENAFESLRREKGLREELERKKLTVFDPGNDVPLPRRFDRVVDRWMALKVEARQVDEGRKIIFKLEELYPDSPVARKWRDEYANRAKALVAKAVAFEKAGEPREAILTLLDAVHLFPNLPLVRTEFERLHKLHPVLRVAVDHLPLLQSGPAGWTPADWRDSELMHIPLARLKNPEAGDDIQSAVIASLEKSNINKRMTVKLNQGVRWPGDGKTVTAVDVQRLLASCCRPTNPLYHPALARLVGNLEVDKLDSLHVDFDRPQFQPGAWLQIPFLRVGNEPVTGKARHSHLTALSGLGPYRLFDLQPERATFVFNPLYLEKDKPNIKLLTETRLAASADRLRQMQLRDIDLITYLPPRQLGRVKSVPGAKVVRTSVPRIHVLQFNLDRRELQNRALRRAIDYAINREGVFAAVELKPGEQDRVITGPLPYGSFGYAVEIKPRPFDPSLAKTLVIAAAKQLQSIPTLTLAHAGNETSRAACQEIVADLAIVGIKVSLIELDEKSATDPLSADMRYQICTVTDPIYDTITLLTRDNPSLGRFASPWLRQQLVELVQVANITEAKNVLPKLHRVLFEDVAILPLWQWHDHFVVSAAVSGLPEQMPTVYHRIADWNVAPTYPDAYWTDRP